LELGTRLAISTLEIASLVVIHHTIWTISIWNNAEKDGSGYNRKNDVQLNTKSKVGGAITNGEYSSQETKASA
jgi:hypothetical protein